MGGGRSGNTRQLIAAAILVVVAAIAWIWVRGHDAEARKQTDPSACWTASCRDAVIQRNRDSTTGLDLSKPAAER